MIIYYLFRKENYMLKIENIWIYSIQDGLIWGIVIENSKDDAMKKLSIEYENVHLEGICTIVPLTAFELNKPAHEIW